MLMYTTLEDLLSLLDKNFGVDKAIEISESLSENKLLRITDDYIIFFNKDYKAIVESLGITFDIYGYIESLHNDYNGWIKLFAKDIHSGSINMYECIDRITKDDEIEIYNADDINAKINELLNKYAKEIIKEKINELQELLLKDEFDWQ